MTEKNRSVDVTILGGLFVLLGLLTLFTLVESSIRLYPLYNKIILTLGLLPYVKVIILSFCPLAIFMIFLYVISGIGLLKIRFWARYIAIALMITLPLGQLNTVLLLGNQKFSFTVFIITIITALLVLWIITRRKFKRQFENDDIRFRLKSKYGIIIILIILISLLIPIIVFSIKIHICLKYDEPFFISTPQEIKIMPADNTLFSDKYKRIELFGVSFLVPNNFVIGTFLKPRNNSIECIVILTGPHIENGSISLNSKSLFATREVYKSMGFANAYDFEKAVYTSNYSLFPISFRLFLRDLNNYSTIELIDHPLFRGFLTSFAIRDTDCLTYEIYFYSKNTQSSESMSFRSAKKSWKKENILNIISSVTFTENSKAEENRYYKEGVDLLTSNSSDAQFKFANAYYLSPENPEYGYMLAKSLFQQNGRISFHSAERIVEEVLTIKPDYKEANELLDAIKIEMSNILPKTKE